MKANIPVHVKQVVALILAAMLTLMSMWLLMHI